MKKGFTRLVLPLGLAALVLSAGAQDIKRFPGCLQPSGKPAEAPARAPLNTWRGQGVRVFGGTQYDWLHYSNFVDLWSETPSRLNKMEPLYIVGNDDEEYFPSLYTLNAGAWAGDAYYAFRVNRYTFETWVNGWIKADPETGKWQTLKPLYGTPDGNNWNYTYDLAWNPVEDKLYALAQNTDGTVTSIVGLLDKATGDWKETAAVLPEYYFAMAFDYDGRLHAIRWEYDADGRVLGTLLDVFDEDWEVETSTPIRVDGRDFKIYYQNGMTFDYSTGDLWWTATNNEGSQYLVRIDPGTGQTVNKGIVGSGETMVGLHIPYVTADARTAPARVENLSYDINHNGEGKVTLSWRNPEKQWNRFSLKKLAEVRVYRDSYEGEPLAVVPAGADKIGKEMSWTDENAGQGRHTYYVVACSEAGVKGIEDHIEAFAGHDLPGGVRNLTASTSDGKSIHLVWDAPDRGDSDGWFDSSDLTYSITRMPDGKDLGTTAATSLDDKDIPEAQAYSYIVTAINADGRGEGVQSNAVIAGECVLVPFSTDFATKIDADRFTCIDRNGDGRTFDYSMNINLKRNTMHLDVSDYGNDDILVSPPLSVEKGKTYKVTYQFGFGAYGNSDMILSHHLRFTGGTAPTAEGQSDVLGELENFETVGLAGSHEIINYFTAKETGEYYVGFNVLTVPESQMWNYVEGFAIEVAPEDDLCAEKLETPRFVSTVKDNDFKVVVYNNGNNRQSDYKVQVVAVSSIGAREVIAETSEVPVLESHERAVISLRGCGGWLGEVRYVGVVVLDKDGNQGNNETPAVTVNAEEAAPFNATVTNGDEGTNTRIPMSHYFGCTGTQTIYTPDMTRIGTADGSDITITRLAWEYEGKESFDGTELRVWLSTTDKYCYDEGDEFLAVAAAPVYDGTVRVEKGESNYMVIDLDEPFSYSPDKNLVVTVSKRDFNHSDWLTVFRVFDSDWYIDEFHSIFTGGSDEYDPTYPLVGTRYPDAPVLHLALENGTVGTGMVFAGSGTVYYDADARMLRCNGCSLSGVTVWNFAGGIVDSMRFAAGRQEAGLDLPAGAYVIKADLAEGRPVALKVFVTR